MKLADMGHYFGLGQEQHRSIADVRMNIEVFKDVALTLFLESNFNTLFPAPVNTAPEKKPRKARTPKAKKAVGSTPKPQESTSKASMKSSVASSEAGTEPKKQKEKAATLLAPESKSNGSANGTSIKLNGTSPERTGPPSVMRVKSWADVMKKHNDGSSLPSTQPHLFASASVPGVVNSTIAHPMQSNHSHSGVPTSRKKSGSRKKKEASASESKEKDTVDGEWEVNLSKKNRKVLKKSGLGEESAGLVQYISVLETAMKSGDTLWMKYSGGKNPGKPRQIIPRAWVYKPNLFSADCIPIKPNRDPARFASKNITQLQSGSFDE